MDTKLSHRIYRPAATAAAVVFIVHGMQEHKDRYALFADYLTLRNYACITYDLIGHGHDTAKDDLGFFGDRDGWNRLVATASEINDLAKKEFPGVPTVFFGHSMGTMIGRSFLQKHDDAIDAMILSGPPCANAAAGLAKVIAKAVIKTRGARKRSELLTNLAVGGFNKSIRNPRTKLDWLSYNAANVDAYIADELCGVPFTNQGYLDLFEGMAAMSKPSLYQMACPALPILLFAGHDDPCIGGEKGWQDTVNRLKKLGYGDVSTRLYEGMRHETLQEADNASVMKDVADWLDQKLIGRE